MTEKKSQENALSGYTSQRTQRDWGCIVYKHDTQGKAHQRNVSK